MVPRAQIISDFGRASQSEGSIFRASTVCRCPCLDAPYITLNFIALAGNYERAVDSSNSAAAITSVLYPNDHTSCMLHPTFCIIQVLIGDSREGAAPEATVFL